MSRTDVHVSNTAQFVDELQRARKPFEMMLYPRSQHGVSEPALVKHLRETMLAFTLRYPGPQNESGGGAATRP